MKNDAPVGRRSRPFLIAILVLTMVTTAGTSRAEDKPRALQAEITHVERLIPAASELLLKLQNDPLRPKSAVYFPFRLAGTVGAGPVSSRRRQGSGAMP